MTGILHALVASAVGGVYPTAQWLGWTVDSTQGAGLGNVQSVINFNPSGLIDTTTAGNAGGTGQAGSPWYYPLSAGVGALYWCRATLTGGTAPDIGTFGAWQQMNVIRSWGWNAYSVAGTKTATITVDISSSPSGSPILLSAQLIGIKCAHG